MALIVNVTIPRTDGTFEQLGLLEIRRQERETTDEPMTYEVGLYLPGELRRDLGTVEHVRSDGWATLAALGLGLASVEGGSRPID